MSLVTFWELLEDAFLNPASIDYGLLRALYAASAHYLPYGHRPDGVEILHRHLEAQEWEEAIAVVEDLLVDDPLAIALRLAYAHALDGIGDDWEASTQRAVANGLIKAVMRSGDGRSPDSPLRVLDERELHLIVDLLGTRAARTRMDLHEDRWLAVVEAADGRSLYFDVTWPQGWLASREDEPDETA